jgi:hypothetical protein
MEVHFVSRLKDTQVDTLAYGHLPSGKEVRNRTFSLDEPERLHFVLLNPTWYNVACSALVRATTSDMVARLNHASQCALRW